MNGMEYRSNYELSLAAQHSQTERRGKLSRKSTSNPPRDTLCSGWSVFVPEHDRKRGWAVGEFGGRL